MSDNENPRATGEAVAWAFMRDGKPVADTPPCYKLPTDWKDVERAWGGAFVPLYPPIPTHWIRNMVSEILEAGRTSQVNRQAGAFKSESDWKECTDLCIDEWVQFFYKHFARGSGFPTPAPRGRVVVTEAMRRAALDAALDGLDVSKAGWLAAAVCDRALPAALALVDADAGEKQKPCPRWSTCFSHDCTCHPTPARAEAALPYNAVSVNDGARGMEWRVPLWDAIDALRPKATIAERMSIVPRVERAVKLAMRIAVDEAAPTPARAEGAGEDAEDAARYRYLRSIALGDDCDTWSRWYFQLDAHCADAESRFDAMVDAAARSTEGATDA